MPIDYQIDERREILIVMMSGQLTREDFLRFFADSAKDPRFRGDMGRLVLATDATAFPPSAEVSEVSEVMRRRTSGQHPRFAVVAHTPLAIGIASMFMGQSGLSDNFQIFPDRAAAAKWLTAHRPDE